MTHAAIPAMSNRDVESTVPSPHPVPPPSDGGRGALDDLPGAVREMRERFLETVEPVRAELWDYCRRLTGSPWEAEDLVQDTLLRAFARLGHLYQPVRDPRAWLFRVATNGWIDQVRRDRGVEQAEAPEIAAPDSDAADLRVRAGEALEHLVRHVPPRQRAALLLAEAFGFTAPEIGSMMGLTPGAAKALLHRARTVLRRGVPGDSGLERGAESGAGGLAQRRVLEVLADAFNRRDARAIVALLEEEAEADIVGVAAELGRDAIRTQSLAEALSDPVPHDARVAVVAGEAVVAVFHPRPDGGEELGWIIRPGLSDGRVCRWGAYYFTPELLREAGRELGVPVREAGYRYVPPEG